MPFVNGGKKLIQNLFHEYKIEEKNHFPRKKGSVKGCDKFVDEEMNFQ